MIPSISDPSSLLLNFEIIFGYIGYLLFCRKKTNLLMILPIFIASCIAAIADNLFIFLIAYSSIIITITFYINHINQNLSKHYFLIKLLGILLITEILLHYNPISHTFTHIKHIGILNSVLLHIGLYAILGLIPFDIESKLSNRDEFKVLRILSITPVLTLISKVGFLDFLDPYTMLGLCIIYGFFTLFILDHHKRSYYLNSLITTFYLSMNHQYQIEFIPLLGFMMYLNDINLGKNYKYKDHFIYKISSSLNLIIQLVGIFIIANLSPNKLPNTYLVAPLIIILFFRFDFPNIVSSSKNRTIEPEDIYTNLIAYFLTIFYIIMFLYSKIYINIATAIILFIFSPIIAIFIKPLRIKLDNHYLYPVYSYPINYIWTAKIQNIENSVRKLYNIFIPKSLKDLLDTKRIIILIALSLSLIIVII